MGHTRDIIVVLFYNREVQVMVDIESKHTGADVAPGEVRVFSAMSGPPRAMLSSTKSRSLELLTCDTPMRLQGV